jgi:hypothetical protein
MENKQTYVKSVVVSAHGDTNWTQHSLEVRDVVNKKGEKESEYYGHMDNFGGVYGAMQAYFSGRLPKKNFRLEITSVLFWTLQMFFFRMASLWSNNL